MEAADGGGHEDGAAYMGDAQPQQTGLIPGDVAQPAAEDRLSPERLLGVLKEELSGIGEAQGRLPLKKAAAQFLFQGGDVGGESLLGNEELFRRPGEVPFPGQSADVFHGLKVHTGCLPF